MRGKVCLVTGGTSGIGLETARGLAKLGATVIIVGRNAEKAESVVRDIRASTRNDAVSFLIADLSSQQQVRALADDFRKHYLRLDVLVNNAGALYLERQLSVDGIEMTFAVNHLAPFLLTNLLLDLLKSSAPSRIVTVASDAHGGAVIDLENVSGDVGRFGMKAYGKSKLANILFTYELARRLAGTGVTANTLHPGVVATGFGKNNGWLISLIMGAFGRFSLKPTEGAETSIYLASSPEVESVTGKYFSKKKQISSSNASYDVATAKRLWELSEQLTGLTPSPASA